MRIDGNRSKPATVKGGREMKMGAMECVGRTSVERLRGQPHEAPN
jgi:hypothetical protein